VCYIAVKFNTGKMKMAKSNEEEKRIKTGVGVLIMKDGLILLH